jgi:hypothetical protein
MAADIAAANITAADIAAANIPAAIIIAVTIAVAAIAATAIAAAIAAATIAAAVIAAADINAVIAAAIAHTVLPVRCWHAVSLRADSGASTIPWLALERSLRPPRGPRWYPAGVYGRCVIWRGVGGEVDPHRGTSPTWTLHL